MEEVEDIKIRLHDVEKEIKSIKKTQKRMWLAIKSVSSDLEKLVNLLNQIRYMGIGAITFYLAMEIGIAELLKKFLSTL